ncbi:MAG: pyridoxamine 5'-phosphate oxidase family protein [Janthinobacterium lividum]
MTAPISLQDVCTHAFRQISLGVADHRSPFRTPTLATTDADGCPGLRSVVLRGFNPATRRLVIHSDRRAAKVAEIAVSPRVALHVWDDGAKVQVRLDGAAALQPEDVARTEWDRLHSGSRDTYRIRPAPGTALADPAVADTDRVDEDAAYANFAVIAVQVDGMEWLHLARDGHRRAAFTWTADGMQAEWLVP